jgi:hypothetical protein
MPNKRIDVVKTPEGWAGKSGGKSVVKPQPTQAAAEKLSKDLARKLPGGAEVATHGRDGRIRSSDTIGGKDPNPPRDKEH